ncbi:MAG: hypothetical protein WBC65_00890 [Ignavibacteria bacterium]
MNKILTLVFAISLIALASCNQSTKQNNPTNSADAIYYGGDIVTMEGDNPKYAEAIAVKNGKIVLVGTKADTVFTVNTRWNYRFPNTIQS